MNDATVKLPENDAELEKLLKSLGRSKEQIEAIKDFGKLSKALGGSEQECKKTVEELGHKYNKKGGEYNGNKNKRCGRSSK